MADEPTPPVDVEKDNTTPTPPEEGAKTPAAEAEKPVDAKAEETPTEEKPVEEKEKEPIDYGEFTVPEGFEALDAKMVEIFKPVAQKLGLDKEGAQELVDMYAGLKNNEALAEKEVTKALHEKWTNDSKTDPEFGGVKYAENMALTVKIIDSVFSKDFRTMLDETGLGNHPEVIRGFVKLGGMISEDRFVGSNGGGGDKVEKTHAEILYGK